MLKVASTTKLFFAIKQTLRGSLCDNWKPSFLPHLTFNWRNFRGELQHVGHVSEQKVTCRPIRTREIGGVRL